MPKATSANDKQRRIGDQNKSASHRENTQHVEVEGQRKFGKGETPPAIGKKMRKKKKPTKDLRSPSGPDPEPPFPACRPPPVAACPASWPRRLVLLRPPRGHLPRRDTAAQQQTGWEPW